MIGKYLSFSFSSPNRMTGIPYCYFYALEVTYYKTAQYKCHVIIIDISNTF